MSVCELPGHTSYILMLLWHVVVTCLIQTSALLQDCEDANPARHRVAGPEWSCHKLCTSAWTACMPAEAVLGAQQL